MKLYPVALARDNWNDFSPSSQEKRPFWLTQGELALIWQALPPKPAKMAFPPWFDNLQVACCALMILWQAAGTLLLRPMAPQVFLIQTFNFYVSHSLCMNNEHDRQVLQEAVRNFYLKSCGRHRQAVGPWVSKVRTVRDLMEAIWRIEFDAFRMSFRSGGASSLQPMSTGILATVLWFYCLGAKVVLIHVWHRGLAILEQHESAVLRVQRKVQSRNRSRLNWHFFQKTLETLEAILQEFEVLLFAVMCRVPWALKIQKHGARMIKNVAPYDSV